MKRFQECNRVGKIWRYRWYLLIPFKWIWFMYIKPFVVIETELNKDNGYIEDSGGFYNPRGKNLWKLLQGIAQGNMKWYYTIEEVMDKIKK